MNINQFKVLESELDSSKNYILPMNTGLVECRFVQRDPSQIIVYVSSQNGCNKACRFCHLTQTGQTSMNDVTPEIFALQLQKVLFENKNFIVDGLKLNINFMARGEPLSNYYIKNHWKDVKHALMLVINEYDINSDLVKFNISTIIPKDVEKTAFDIFNNDKNVWIYWSYYSHQMAFRKRWMPNASSIDGCLNFIGNHPNVVIHNAFIDKENDKISNLKKMLFEHPDWKMNIVRYNPYSEKQGEEAKNIGDIITELTPFGGVQVVPRVGFDVKASCGMFIEK